MIDKLFCFFMNGTKLSHQNKMFIALEDGRLFLHKWYQKKLKKIQLEKM